MLFSMLAFLMCVAILAVGIGNGHHGLVAVNLVISVRVDNTFQGPLATITSRMSIVAQGVCAAEGL